MSKIYPGYKQTRLNHNVVIQNLPKIIVKARPYVYSSGEIHSPDSDIKIVADLWVIQSCLKNGKIDVGYKPRCLIDVENNEIRDKHGYLIDSPNGQEVIDVIYAAVFEGSNGTKS